MDDAVAVGVMEAARDRRQDERRFLGREGAPGDRLGERRTFDVLEDQIVPSLVASRVEHLDDGRVGKAGHDEPFLDEAVGEGFVARPLVGENLERDNGAGSVGFVDRSHRPLAQLAQQRAAAQRVHVRVPDYN